MSEINDTTENPIFKEISDIPSHPMSVKLVEDIEYYSEKLSIPAEILNNLVCRGYVLGKMAQLTMIKEKMSEVKN